MISRSVWFAALLLLLCKGVAFCKTSVPSGVNIRSAPEHPIVEVREGNQFLNFDMIVQNTSRSTLRISQIELSVYDSAHLLVLQKSINTDAFAPSIAVIGKEILAPGETLDVFNPFSEFESSVPLTELEYSFCLLRESNEQQRETNRHRLPDDCDLREQLAVSPRTYENRTALILPLRGRIFVWEGHDLYAHHQRVPLGNSKVRSRGITANSNDFASDFIYVDAQGRITTIPASWITGTVTAGRSMRQGQELFSQLQMTFRKTGLKMPEPRRLGIQNFRLAKMRKISGILC